MENVVVFLDYANINRSASDNNYQLDYGNLLNYLSEGRFLIDAYCYVPIDPRNEHRLDGMIQNLWSYGYLVNTKVGTIKGDSYKCNVDVEMTMDILRVTYQVKPDIVVLVSGDVDFIPVIQELRKNGIRVEVASFESSASRDLMLKCSGFINLDSYYNDYLSQFQENEPETQQVAEYNDSDDDIERDDDNVEREEERDKEPPYNR
jgi:uncharacterized LabA/DUF88 family protein